MQKPTYHHGHLGRDTSELVLTLEEEEALHESHADSETVYLSFNVKIIKLAAGPRMPKYPKMPNWRVVDAILH